jgi:hypothetical protein
MLMQLVLNQVRIFNKIRVGNPLVIYGNPAHVNSFGIINQRLILSYYN